MNQDNIGFWEFVYYTKVKPAVEIVLGILGLPLLLVVTVLGAPFIYYAYLREEYDKYIEYQNRNKDV